MDGPRIVLSVVCKHFKTIDNVFSRLPTIPNLEIFKVDRFHDDASVAGSWRGLVVIILNGSPFSWKAGIEPPKHRLSLRTCTLRMRVTAERRVASIRAATLTP